MALVASLSTWDDPTTSARGAQQYADLSRAAQIVRDSLYPCDIATSKSVGNAPESAELSLALQIVTESGHFSGIFADFLESVHARFFQVRRDIARFMGRLQETQALSVISQSDDVMREMLERLAVWQRTWAMPLKRLHDNKLLNTYTSTFQSLLHASLPPKFLDHLRDFLASSLAALPTPLHDVPAEAVPGAPIRTHTVPLPSPYLARLALFLRYSSTFMNVALAGVERIVKEEAERGWDVRCLVKARKRVNYGVVSWLAGMMATQGHGSEALEAAMRSMSSRFDYHLCKCFFAIRTDELFDIIVDYPDSISALEDLKECLFKVDQRDLLVEKLRAANLKRLLHPGAATKDVLTQYISTIRCLRILDPPGVLLHKVAGPIRAHLRDRPDTTRNIVSALVEGEELQDENEVGVLARQANDDEVEDFSDPRWEPEPVDAAPEFRSGRAGDIVSTLVSIYETREVIIKELQILLAQRLFAVKDYDAVKEIRIIELLKLRFGEQALQVCDVMLKDMADSKRIDDRIQGDIQTPVHPLVVSHRFWPEIQATSLHLPPKLEEAQRDYEAAFNQFKPDKHLRWIQHLGTVRLRFEMEDRVVEAEADPVQAAVAELFEQQAEWTVAAIGDRLDLGDKAVRDALVFWAGFGLVKESHGRYKVQEREEL